MTRKGITSLIPVVVTLLAIVAFLVVLNFAITPSKQATTNTTVSQNTNSIANTNVVVNTNTTANANTSTDATKDWKTYTNTKWGFSFKYPRNAAITREVDNKTGILVIVSDTVTLSNGDSITTAEYDIRLNPDGYGPQFPYKTWTIEKTTNAGFAVVSEKVESTTSPNPSRIELVATEASAVSGTGFRMNFFTDPSLDKTAWENKLRNVLSSFTFTDPTAGWKTYTSSEGQVSFKYPSEWPTWGKEETSKYTGQKEFYPPSGEYITRTGKHLQIASGGTSNDPLHFVVSDSNDFTRAGDGACTDIYHCWAPLATSAISKACSDKKYEGASFVGCTTVDGAQALAIITNDVDVANYYLLVFFGKTYNGYDRWVVGEQLRSTSGFPQDSVRAELLKGVDTNQHKQDLYTLLSTWKSDPTAGWKTYANSKYGFSMKYPATFSDFVANSGGIGYRGLAIVSAGTGGNGSIDISVKDKKYDPNSIEGLYGPVQAKDITAVTFGSRSGSMYLDGDAGCGGQEALTNLNSSQTLWMSFMDCEDTQPHTPFYNQKDLINQILTTFTFTK